MRGNSKGRYTFLMLAGVYLLYLCWQLIKGFRSGEATSPVFVIAAVVFFIAGILVIVSNIRQILKISDEEAKANAESGDAQNTDAESADIEGSDTESAGIEGTDAESAGIESTESGEPAPDAAADAIGKKASSKNAPLRKSGASLFDRAGLGAVSDEETTDGNEAETDAGNDITD